MQKDITFIGDVHGKWTPYRRLLKQFDTTVQVGDMGFGFPGWEKTDPKKFREEGNHYFIRGNHDSPDIIRKYPNYLGDFGYNEELGIFYVGGANSIDRAWRTEGSSWWSDEELSYKQFQDVLDLYRKVRPKVVVTHDCPKHIQMFLVSHHDENSRTNGALQMMVEEHQPDVWVFGHHHKWFHTRVYGTRFQCVPELGAITLEEILDDDNPIHTRNSRIEREKHAYRLR